MAFVDQVSHEARQVEFSPAAVGRFLLTLVGGLLYALGWVAARVVRFVMLVARVLWVGVVWSVTAVRLGWREGWTPARGG